MRRKSLVMLMLLTLFASGAVVAAQGNLGHLRSWAGKYPTDRRGRVSRSFFRLAAVQRPLARLLSRRDLNLLTRVYKVETPIKEIGDYLAVKVCRPHDCSTDQAGFAINLRDGSIFVRMKEGDEVRWFASSGDNAQLPQDVRDYLTDFAAN